MPPVRPPGSEPPAAESVSKLSIIPVTVPRSPRSGRSATITLAQAAAAAANTPLKSFPEDADMLVKNGRYGAYIAYKGKNYRLPKGSKPEELTLDDCLKIVADSKK